MKPWNKPGVVNRQGQSAIFCRDPGPYAVTGCRVRTFLSCPCSRRSGKLAPRFKAAYPHMLPFSSDRRQLSTAREAKIHLFPFFLTFCNLVFGVLAMWISLSGDYPLAVGTLFLCMVFDLLDGVAARRLGGRSRAGEISDSAADSVSFGIAPPFLICASTSWSLSGLLLGSFFLAATVLRLYVYHRVKSRTPRGFFRGLPSPAATWLCAPAVLWLPPAGQLVLLVAAALLMCSFFIRWLHFRFFVPTLTWPEIGLFVSCGALLYVIFGPAALVNGIILPYLASPLWKPPLAPPSSHVPAR